MDTSQNSVHEKDDSPSRTILFKYLPYWPLFLIMSVVCIGLAFFFLWFVTPSYQATAVLIVKDQKKGFTDSKMEASLDLIADSKIIENEIEVIKSRTLMIDVVRKLHIYAPVYKDLKIKSVSAYISSPLIIEASNPDSIVETPLNPKIYMAYNKAKGTVLLDTSFTCKINQWQKTPFGTLRFSPNPKYFDDSLNAPLYFILYKPKDVALMLSVNLTAIKSDILSSVIDLTYLDEIPKRAEDILNELLNSYTQASLDAKSVLANNTLSFVEDRLAIVTHELDSIEKQIEQYKSGAGAVNLTSEGQLYLQNVSTNDQKVGDINMQLAALGEIDKFVRSKDNSAGIVPSTVGINDPGLTQLTTSLYTTQLDYDRLKKTVAENNPLLVSLSDQINKIKPDIISHLESQRKSLEASKNQLSSTSNSYASVLQNIPVKEKQLLEISRAQAIKSNIYAFLLQKREESVLASEGTDSDSRIVDRAQAIPTRVFPPKSLFIYAASIFLALLLTIGLVTARDFFNGKVLYRNELERLTSFPVIGEIAYKKSKNPIVIEAGKRTFIAEEFRKIRVALSFLGIGENAKKILVTSSIPGEGKSFVAANLAVSLALTGKKVVIVDLDLNNPVLARTFDIEESSGISDYLTGEKDPEDIIKRVSVHENLFFVPSGKLPPDPSELLSNGKVKDILFYLQNVFDFVIIDTAPVFAVSDTYMLSDYCDASLYIVRHNYTPKKIIKRIAEKNKINPLTNPAIIFNGLKARGFSRKTTNGYGYDYLYEYKQKKPKKSKTQKVF